MSLNSPPQTASAIAKETTLTPAAVTALIDRLEARKLVLRHPDASDRRKVLVEATDKTRELIQVTYTPTGGEPNSESKRVTLKLRRR